MRPGWRSGARRNMTCSLEIVSFPPKVASEDGRSVASRQWRKARFREWSDPATLALVHPAVSERRVRTCHDRAAT